MESQRNIPEIRFKGFEEDWKENDLGKISKITTGNSNRQDSGEDGEYTFFDRSEDIRKSNIYLFDCEAIIIGGEGSEFIPKYFTGKFDLHQRAYAIMNFNDVNGKFLYYYIYLNRQYFLNQAVGSTVKSLRLPMFQNMPIKLSKNLNEQTKIGNYFKELDSLILNSKLKIKKLNNIKKAMLDKMFPKSGTNVPEIRFKGFDDAWEEKEINILVDRYNNLRVPITANKRVSGSTPYYGANGIQDYVEGYTHYGEFILIAEDGANDLKNYPIQYVNGKIWVNNHTHVLQGKKDIANNLFLKYAFSQTNIEPFLVGGGRAKLNVDTMMKIEVYVSLNIKEQTKIGNYFKELENLINLHQQKLEKLKNIKKAYFKKMFVQDQTKEVKK